MGEKFVLILFFGFFIFGISFSSSSYNGTFIGNETTTIKNTSAEFDVIANISATKWWAEVQLNTSEINFGNVQPKKNWNSYRAKYKIKARGNVDVDIIPTLVNSNDNIFSNLYFARIFESSKSKWTKIGFYKMKFNLTKNEGYWSVLTSSGLENATNSNGEQSILLDLSEYEDPIPFTIENYRNSIKFIIVPDWSSVNSGSP